MGFRGPSRGIDTTAFTLPIKLQREQDQDAFSRALQMAELGNRASSIMGQGIERDQERRAGEEAGRARLAMTPGVRQGGAGSRWGMSVADSPALQPRSFRQFGQDYSFDPVAAGEAEGAASGVAQNTEESTRMEALKRIPGLSPRQASRMVYGRTGVMDEADPSVMRTALSEYLRAPSREAAARAIEAGASANTFPDRYFLPEGEAEPRRGSPEYMAMRRAELEQQAEVQTAALERQAPIRADATAAARVPREPWEVRAASTDMAARRREHQASLRTRPRPGQFVDPMTNKLMPEPYREAMEGFRADSTATADALTAAQEQLRAVSGEEPTAPGARHAPAPVSAPAAAPVASGPEGDAEQAAIAQEMQDAIRRIMASSLSVPEKKRRVEAVNARARQLLGGKGR